MPSKALKRYSTSFFAHASFDSFPYSFAQSTHQRDPAMAAMTQAATSDSSAAAITPPDSVVMAQEETGPVAVPEMSEKARRYYESGNVLWSVNLVEGLLIPALFLFTGFSAKIRNWAQQLGRRWFFVIGVYFIILTVINFIIDLPLSYYQGFVRQHVYDLSNQTFGKWIGDALKALMVGIAGGVLFLWVPYLLLKKSPRRWWLYTGILMVPFLFKELLFVMGHEMGHYVLGHVIKGVLFFSLLILVTLYAAYRTAGGLINKYKVRFGFDQLSDIASLPLIMLLVSIFTLVITPIAVAFTRYQEHEADRFGLEITQSNHAAANAFVKLQQENLGNPRPGVLYKLWRASHPTLGDRIDFCNAYRPWESGEALKYGELFEK